MDRMSQIQTQIDHLNNMKRQLRQREKNLQARSQYLANPSQFQSGTSQELKGSLDENLPAFMSPANVGGINEVSWINYFNRDLDYDCTNVVENNIVKTYFQVDMESAFVLCAISKSYSIDENLVSAAMKAPLQVEFIDRQSSRRFNDGPLPIHTLGENSNLTVLPIPMLLMPNAFLDISVSGIPAQGAPQSFAGSGKINFSFFGYRTRIDNAKNLMSLIFT